MSLLDILIFPDPGLKTIAAPVQQIDDEIKQLVRDMLDTMHHAEGIGLANEIEHEYSIPIINKRIAVIDISENKKAPLCIINPVITQHNGKISWQEGCLSFPGIYTNVKRYETVTVEYQDLDNKPQTINATGLLSVCLQHEIDHLNGITFYERISTLRRTLLKKKLKGLGKE